MTVVTRVQALCSNGLNSCLAEIEGYTLALKDNMLCWRDLNHKLLKGPPNYTGDLNVMARIEEKYLTSPVLKAAFSTALSKFIDNPSDFSLSHATPKQHAQAFLVVAMRYLGYKAEKVTHEATED